MIQPAPTPSLAPDGTPLVHPPRPPRRSAPIWRRPRVLLALLGGLLVLAAALSAPR
jgi:hypothetical protein